MGGRILHELHFDRYKWAKRVKESINETGEYEANIERNEVIAKYEATRRSS